MKKIAVVEKFFESHHQQQIETVAGKHGYTDLRAAQGAGRRV